MEAISQLPFLSLKSSYSLTSVPQDYSLPRTRIFVNSSKELSPFRTEKTSSIPELKDLSQERAFSRLKSRNSSSSKSPKKTLNDLELQWRKIKDEHQNFEM